jgi:hypothetical protein
MASIRCRGSSIASTRRVSPGCSVFRDNGVRWRLHVFKLLYYITSLVYWRDSWASWMRRRRGVSMRFTGDTIRQDPA